MPSRKLALRNLPKSIGHLIFMVWFTITLIFLALLSIRGNPISLYLDPRVDYEKQEQLKEAYGYQKNPFIQYTTYMGNVLQGEMGQSFLFKRPVAEVIPGRLRSSVGLGLIAYFLAAFFSLFLLMGMHLARSDLVQRSTANLHTMIMSVPSFVLGTLLMGFLGVRYQWFPIVGSQDLFAEDLGFWNKLLDLAHHAALPVISLALPLAGQLTAYLHEQMDDLDGAPFILSARGRGLSETRIFFNHKLRVLLPGIIQLGGLYLPTVAVGTLIIESIFGWSGMGQLLFESVLARDYPLLLGGSIWTVIFVVVGYEMANYLRMALTHEEVPY